MSNEAEMWFVTIERNGKKQVRLMDAQTAEEAGAKTCALVGGPAASEWQVIRCTPASSL